MPCDRRLETCTHDKGYSNSPLDHAAPRLRPSAPRLQSAFPYQDAWGSVLRHRRTRNTFSGSMSKYQKPLFVTSRSENSLSVVVRCKSLALQIPISQECTS